MTQHLCRAQCSLYGLITIIHLDIEMTQHLGRAQISLCGLITNNHPDIEMTRHLDRAQRSLYRPIITLSGPYKINGAFFDRKIYTSPLH